MIDASHVQDIRLTDNETRFLLWFVAALLSAVTVIGGWVGRRFVARIGELGKVGTASAEKLTRLGIALYGDDQNPVPNGAIRKLDAVATSLDQHATDFAVHIAEETQWRADAARLSVARNNDLQTRLTGIEDRLPSPRKRRIS